MDDGLLGAFQRLEGAGDQILSRLGQHLDGDVVGNMAALDQLANEVEIGLRSGGKPTSISLRPTCTNVLKKRIFFAASIGSISDWLPSRRSELSQIGAWVMAFDGGCDRGCRWPGRHGIYSMDS